MTHTKGPWHIENFVGVYSNCGQLVASIHSSIPKTARADANLIAAAPDLLEVLQEIMSWEENAQMAWAQRANAAIAKATGVA